MQSNTYLYFDGQCEAAFKFYELCLSGKIVEMMTYGEIPTDSSMAEEIPPEFHRKIMHTTLTIGNIVLMGSDALPDIFEKPQGFSVSLQFNFNEAEEGKRIFHELAKNGTVQMPFEKNFWSSGFGTLVDQFGIPWMVNCAPAA